MALPGLLGEVTVERVSALLQQRRPAILDTNTAGQAGQFESRVQGAGVTVVLLVGADLPEGPLRDLAVEAVATEVAAQIEYAEYPEQQERGEEGRGYHLHQRYLELLALLRSYIETGTVSGVAGVPRPLGSFPPAPCYPDPAYPVHAEVWPCC